MKIQTKIIIITSIFLLVLISLNLASALVIKNVDTGKLYPGKEADLTISVKNDGDRDIEDVSLSLDFSNMPISSIGSSEKTVDEIQEDDSENFNFRIKSDNTAKLGSYNIPYNLKYNSTVLKGTIGVEVSGNVELEYSINQENNIVGKQGKINLKIVNKGLADARFVAVKITPNGYTLLGSDENYIGTVSSDDFETASFDAIFNSQSESLIAIIEYRDFENNKKIDSINLPFNVYTQEQALRLGIIKKSYAAYYFVGIVVLIVLYLIYRSLRKRARKKKANNEARWKC